MRKLVYGLLIITLVFTLFPFNTKINTTNAAEVGTNFYSELLDVKEEHTSKEKVTFSITVPKDAEQIDLNSLKVESGEIIRTGAEAPKYDPTTRKITFTVKGKVITTPKKAVIGLSSRNGEPFQSNPGNAVCRYSDGMKWQINSRNQTDLKTNLTDYVNTDKSVIPTKFPADIMRKVLTATDRTLNVNDTYFFAEYEQKDTKDARGPYFIDLRPKEGAQPIDRSLIDPSSLKVPKSAVKAIDTSSNAVPFFPSKYDEKNPTIGVYYNMELGDYYDNTMRYKIKPNDPKFLTGHAGCWMYQAYYQYYITAYTLEHTAYEYKGNVTFDYIIYGTATLVGTLKADPSSVQYKDKDIVVDLILEGEVINIEDPGALDYYNLYVRLEDGTMISTAADVNIPANGKATIKRTFKYTISKSRLSSSSVTELTQKFSGRVTGAYKASSYYTGELNSGELQASTYVYKKPPETPPPPTGTPKQPPVAVINGVSEVKKGDLIQLDGLQSYDPDGTVEEYRWSMPNSKEATIVLEQFDSRFSTVNAWYAELGTQKALLHVKDNDGLQGAVYHSFVVTEPTVDAEIHQTGTLKENRKVTFTESSSSPFKYPVIAEKTTWKIESENGNLNDQIKYTGGLTGKKSIDVLFKKAGRYRVTLTVENTAGYTDVVQRIYTVRPDEEPMVDYSSQQKVYRDPNNGNLATFDLVDQSYSVDGDLIVKRTWYVVYDANNDGVFDEAKVMFNTGNNTSVQYQTNKVGKYAFYLEVQEEFGQPTIEQFVTANDRKKGRTW